MEVTENGHRVLILINKNCCLHIVSKNSKYFITS